jgi:protocatechuate 4,5-dioxygenase, beta chain
MAKIVGGIATSHIPAIGAAIGQGLQQDPYWKPFFDGYPPVREWLNKVKPDVAVVVYNDHGLNFFLDKMPTFSIGAAPQYCHADEGWGIPTTAPYPGDPKMSWHIINSLFNDEFDLCTCQEMLVDHGFTVPMSLLWPERGEDQIKTIPFCVNTVQHPIASPKRCIDIGRALGKAIASYPEDTKVVILGTGGLSHQLDGERAGFINKKFDLECMEKIITDPDYYKDMSIHELVKLAGAQGAEFILWLIMRTAMGDNVKKIHSNYHIPISNTGAGLLCLENDA